MEGDCDYEFLISGIENGFHVVDVNNKPVDVETQNYKSALCNRELVEKQIVTEVEEGRYVIVDSKPVIVSALGAIPKTSNNGVRLIHDCSRPASYSVNDYASLCDKVKYQSVSDACNLVNNGYFMAKVDLKSAYRSVPIHPSNYVYSGLKWTFSGTNQPQYMVDTRLMFGSRLAPGIFHRLTQAIRRIINRLYGASIIAYLDDLLVIAPSYDECNTLLHQLITLLRSLGFSIAWEKVVSPTQQLTFLGIDINSVSMQITLPADKVQEVQNLINKFIKCKRASKKDLERLAGKLSYAAHVVQGGRIYLRRIFCLLKSLKLPHHKAKLTVGFYKDLAWWQACLREFNGKNIVPSIRDVYVVGVDACNQGAGFACSGDWGYVNWAKDVPVAKNLHINDKEVLSALFAVRRWGPLWKGARVLLGTDSMVAKMVLSKGRSKSALAQQAVREIFWWSVKYDFELDVFHIPGVKNELCDAISRIHNLGDALRFRSYMLKYCIWEFPLYCHMSYNSLIYISQQWRKHWMRR